TLPLHDALPICNQVSYLWNHRVCSAYIFARRDAQLLAGMGVPGNIRIFYSDHYRISGAARSKAPRTANKRGTSGGEGTSTKSYRYAYNFPFRGHFGVFRA